MRDRGDSDKLAKVSHMRSFNIVMLGLLLGAACGGPKEMNTPRPPPTSTPTPAEPPVNVITTNHEARAAVGKVVRISGTVQREKLGDTVNVGGLFVRCPDFRFPNASTGSTVTAEGKLDIVVEEDETLSPNGDHNQGYKGGGSTFVIYHCVVR